MAKWMSKGGQLPDYLALYGYIYSSFISEPQGLPYSAEHRGS